MKTFRGRCTCGCGTETGDIHMADDHPKRIPQAEIYRHLLDECQRVISGTCVRAENNRNLVTVEEVAQ